MAPKLTNFDERLAQSVLENADEELALGYDE